MIKLKLKLEIIVKKIAKEVVQKFRKVLIKNKHKN